MGAANPQLPDSATATAVLHVGRQFRASEKAVVEAALGRHAGVVSVDANPVAQTATVRYDSSVASVTELRRVIERCGFECVGCNVPGCLCDPLHEPAAREREHDEAAVERAHAPAGHGEGGHSGHSMDQMAREMRNRFVVALVFTLAILAWSSVGKSVLGHKLATPFGIDRKVWQLILSLPVMWAARGFFTGAASALRQRTLDINVLDAVAIGVSWVYSAAVTADLSGDVSFDAGAMLATFVLLGHWFEMRARRRVGCDQGAALETPPLSLTRHGADRAGISRFAVRQRVTVAVARCVCCAAASAHSLVAALHSASSPDGSYKYALRVASVRPAGRRCP